MLFEVCKRAFDMMCERAKARKASGGQPLAKKQMTQEKIARSWIELEQCSRSALLLSGELNVSFVSRRLT